MNPADYKGGGLVYLKADVDVADRHLQPVKEHGPQVRHESRRQAVALIRCTATALSCWPRGPHKLHGCKLCLLGSLSPLACQLLLPLILSSWRGTEPHIRQVQHHWPALQRPPGNLCRSG